MASQQIPDDVRAYLDAVDGTRGDVDLGIIAHTIAGTSVDEFIAEYESVPRR